MMGTSEAAYPPFHELPLPASNPPIGQSVYCALVTPSSAVSRVTPGSLPAPSRRLSNTAPLAPLPRVSRTLPLLAPPRVNSMSKVATPRRTCCTWRSGCQTRASASSTISTRVRRHRLSTYWKSN